MSRVPDMRLRKAAPRVNAPRDCSNRTRPNDLRRSAAKGWVGSCRLVRLGNPPSRTRSGLSRAARRRQALATPLERAQSSGLQAIR